MAFNSRRLGVGVHHRYEVFGRWGTNINVGGLWHMSTGIQTIYAISMGNHKFDLKKKQIQHFHTHTRARARLCTNVIFRSFRNIINLSRLPLKPSVFFPRKSKFFLFSSIRVFIILLVNGFTISVT